MDADELFGITGQGMDFYAELFARHYDVTAAGNFRSEENASKPPTMTT